MYPAGRNGYVLPEKQDEIYYLLENTVCEFEPPVTTTNRLHDHFVISKQMAICYIISNDYIILYECSLFDF